MQTNIHERAIESAYIREGDARLNASRLSQKPRHGVFYNPRMCLNRDLSIAFTKAYFHSSPRIVVCDAMTGSGIRAARYALEVDNVAIVVAIDKDQQAAEVARDTIRLNHLEGRVNVLESDCSYLLRSQVYGPFDLVDLDPYGSPSPYFESALHALRHGGVLAVTATDTGPLTGSKRSACFRKYGSWSVKAEFGKELAMRTLASSLIMAAGKLSLGVKVVFSHAADSYMRLYASIGKGKSSANRSLRGLRYLGYCHSCLTRRTHDSLNEIENLCVECGCRMTLAGPIWLGSLWDPSALPGMIRETDGLKAARTSQILRILGSIAEESSAPLFYFRSDVMSKNLKIKTPPLSSIVRSLREVGFKATRTHFHPSGFRTDAPVREIEDVLGLLSPREI